MRRFVYIIYALFSLLLFSCHVDEPQNNPAIIGHKGCGPIDENGILIFTQILGKH